MDQWLGRKWYKGPNANNWSVNSYWMVSFSTSGYENLTLFSRQMGENTGPKFFQVEYSTNGSDWTPVVAEDRVMTKSFAKDGSGSMYNRPLPQKLNDLDTVYLRWRQTTDTSIGGGTVGIAGTNGIDDIVVKGDRIQELVVGFDFENSSKRNDTSNNIKPYTADYGIGANKDISEITLVQAVFSEWVQGYNKTGNAHNSTSWHNAGDSYWMLGFSTSGYEDLTLSSKQARSNTGPKNFQVEYSTNGSDWTSIGPPDIAVTTAFSLNGGGSLYNRPLPSEMYNSTDTVYLRWINISASGTVGDTGTNQIDDILVHGYIVKYIVIFKDHDGSEIKREVAKHGSLATAPADPTRFGYTFTGWDTDFSNVTSNLTVTANYTTDVYHITYNLDGGTNASSNPSTYTIETETINLADASKTGYTFDGWYDEASGGNKVDEIAQGTTGDINLYARWTINTHTVIFKNYDGSELDTQTVNYGDAATAPANPTRSGYTFTGWLPGLGDPVTKDTTHVAQWTINQYTVTFNNYDGSVLYTQTVNYGNPATVPANPTRSGYTFKGWSPALGNPVTEDTTHVAQWKKKKKSNPKDATGDGEDSGVLGTETSLVTVKIDIRIASIDYYVNDDLGSMDVAPFIQNGRTFVPVRFIAEAFDLDVDYDPKTGRVETVTIVDDQEEITVTITIGSDIIRIVEDGEERLVQSDVVAFIQNGRTWLPLRAIGEIFGAEFEWGPEGAKVEWVSISKQILEFIDPI